MSEEKSSMDEDKLLTGIYEELSYIDGGVDVEGVDSITTFLPQISKSKKEGGGRMW